MDRPAKLVFKAIVATVAFVGASLAATLIPQPAMAGSCLSDIRETKIDDTQSVRLRELRCRADRDPAVSIGVQFQRLDEIAAGVLLNNGKAPWFDRLYGKTRVLENEVLQEYRNLITKFGMAQRVKDGETEGGLGLAVSGTEQPEFKGPARGAKKGAPKVIQSSVLPRLNDVPLVDELLHILNAPTWPATLNFHYPDNPIEGVAEKDLFQGLQVWRYLTMADLDAYDARLARLNGMLKKSPTRTRGNPKAVQLAKYLTAAGWPEPFLKAGTAIGADGCYALNFFVSWPNFSVTIALVQNHSNRPVTLARLMGGTSGGIQLRELMKSRSTPASSTGLATPEQILQPGEGLIIPLQLTFSHGDADSDEPTDTKEALAYKAEARKNQDALYQRVLSGKPGTSVTLLINTDIKTNLKRGKAPDSYEIRKTRESFKPHAEPVYKNFAFGPEWSLTGLDIGGERIDFTKSDPNFVALTIGDGAGSCPILYTWSEADQRYERFGKIIHKAQTQANKQTQTIGFDGWVSRFLIEEEELEVARLDQARAVIRLADGTLHDLTPESGGLARIDGHSLDIHAGEQVEIVFRLPADFKPDDVIETRLVVHGYYDRYSALLVGLAEAKQRSRTAAPDAGAL